GAGGRRHALGDDDVLDGDRHARKRVEGLSGGTTRVDVGGGRERDVVRHVEERVDGALDRGDAVEVGLGAPDRGHLPCSALLRERCSAQSCEVHRHSSPRICGTRKRPSSWAGAPESACSCVSGATGSSARMTFVSGGGWLVAGTSAVATSL